MSKLLYIKANPKGNENSITFRTSESFIKAYKEANPNDEIVTLDLYQEGIKFLDEQMLTDMFSGKETVMLKYAQQFANADKYVIAAPMWNLGSPAIVKAYFDYVTMVGVTFKYTEQGPVGLLADQGKKAVHIVARGGLYIQPPADAFEMGDRYLKTIMGFMGVTDFTTVTTELTGVLQGEDLENAVQHSIEQAENLAKNF
ncbi:MAG: FMN-dependent NADH-azoreductase [Thermincola sp.]|jgi:FMN-dependent NADH-azoreductase|nr:FMN-dependent NADH-azoreductase [Thermincola sp.]MDT3702846.1 FMN-dependent NADH-azoreductase [Thermincola sp.]